MSTSFCVSVCVCVSLIVVIAAVAVVDVAVFVVIIMILNVATAIIIAVTIFVAAAIAIVAFDAVDSWKWDTTTKSHMKRKTRPLCALTLTRNEHPMLHILPNLSIRYHFVVSTFYLPDQLCGRWQVAAGRNYLF